VEPILHLSIPVRDLSESRGFYVDVLGCDLGRVRDDFIDVWFYGMQVSLHAEPDQVRPVEDQGVQHFGVTLGGDELRQLLQRLDGQPVTWVSPVSTDYPGTSKEQTKAKLADPSGNVIELKTYVDPTAAFAPGT
jgi:extradiol dioxygenase family protein